MLLILMPTHVPSPPVNRRRCCLLLLLLMMSHAFEFSAGVRTPPVLHPCPTPHSTTSDNAARNHTPSSVPFLSLASGMPRTRPTYAGRIGSLSPRVHLHEKRSTLDKQTPLPCPPRHKRHVNPAKPFPVAKSLTQEPSKTRRPRSRISTR